MNGSRVLDPLDRVFRPRSIAFFGASNDPLTMGTGQLANLIIQGFEGKIYPVHPTEENVLGLPAYPDIEHVPETPDLVVMVLPTAIVARLLDDCGRAGVRAAVVVSGGFREVGGEGIELERELGEVVERHGIALIGPNCIGVSNFHIGLNTTYFPYHQEPGGVTIVSQSGTYSCHVYGYTKNLGARLSHTVSVGNSLATDLADCVRYFADDPHTKSIAIYIEGIPDGGKFMEAARYAVARKPVVALYVGGTGAGARAGMSHTGALAGDDDVYSGMLRQAGILRAYTVEELLDWAWALAEQPPLEGKRICVLTNAGGPGCSMADTCMRMGLEVPVLSGGLQARLRNHLPPTAASCNPVDITYHLNVKDIYDRLPRLLLESGEIDGIVMYGAFGSMLFRQIQEKMGDRISYPLERVSPVIMEMAKRFTGLPGEYGMPIVVSSFFGRDDEALAYLSDHGIPVFPTPERTVMAMAALHHRGQVSRRCRTTMRGSDT